MFNRQIMLVCYELKDQCLNFFKENNIEKQPSFSDLIVFDFIQSQFLNFHQNNCMGNPIELFHYHLKNKTEEEILEVYRLQYKLTTNFERFVKMDNMIEPFFDFVCSESLLKEIADSLIFLETQNIIKITKDFIIFRDTTEPRKEWKEFIDDYHWQIFSLDQFNVLSNSVLQMLNLKGRLGIIKNKLRDEFRYKPQYHNEFIQILQTEKLKDGNQLNPLETLKNAIKIYKSTKMKN